MKSAHNPSISIIIPMYNAGEGIRVTLQSIINQTFQDFEVIIVDDGSTDHSVDIAKSFYPMAKLLYQEHAGVTQATITGVKECKGKYIAFIDCWDIAYPHRLELQFRAMETHPSWGASSGHFMLYEQDGTDIGICRLPLSPSEALKDLLYGNSPILNSGAIIRKSVFDEVGGLDPYFFIRQDFDLWSRISLVAEIANIDHVIMRILSTTSGISYQGIDLTPLSELSLLEREERKNKGIHWKNYSLRELYKVQIEEITSQNSINKNKNRINAKYYVKRAGLLLRSGDRRSAFQEFRRALSKDIFNTNAWFGIISSVLLPYTMYKFLLNTYKRIKKSRFSLNTPNASF